MVRNSAGVRKDLVENWIVDPTLPGLTPTRRFHYLSALLSASDFTQPAEEYGNAQDIYLLPLARSAYIQPVLTAIKNLIVPRGNTTPLKQIRDYVRHRLTPGEAQRMPASGPLAESITNVISEARKPDYGLIAMFGNRFPVFLVAKPDYPVKKLPSFLKVRIHYRGEQWFIPHEGSRLFSFDLPEEHFRRYAESGRMNPEAMANMKRKYMNEIIAYYRDEYGRLRLIQFKLEPRWAEQLRDKFDVE